MINRQKALIEKNGQFESRIGNVSKKRETQDAKVKIKKEYEVVEHNRDLCLKIPSEICS